MARVEFDIDTPLPSDRIIAGLTDFSDRRPDVWPGLNREMFKVYEVGDTWAHVQEGNSPSIWARERYDWSTPGTVTWTVEESSFCTPGSFVRAEVTPRDGGSRIHVTWERHPTTLMARFVILPIIVLTRGAPVRSSLVKGLRGLEAQ
jgi:hypothetical protein